MENILEKITLRFPETEAELKEIIENQCAIFGDDAAFYDDLYIWAGKKCTLAAYAGGRAVGAVSFPEITYPEKEKTRVGGYIFAAWVAPEYRGNGIFARLMAEAENIMRARGYDFAFVVPAEEKLFATYEKMGYTVKAENGFPYADSREILREYNPTDDICFGRYIPVFTVCPPRIWSSSTTPCAFSRKREGSLPFPSTATSFTLLAMITPLPFTTAWKGEPSGMAANAPCAGFARSFRRKSGLKKPFSTRFSSLHMKFW